MKKLMGIEFLQITHIKHSIYELKILKVLI